MTVLIAGSGIGRLTLALSLHQIGSPCRVYESVPELKPLGVAYSLHVLEAILTVIRLPILTPIGIQRCRAMSKSETI